MSQRFFIIVKFFVHLVLLFVIDHIKNHKVNYFSVLLYYRFSLELLKGGPQKM